MLRPPVRYRNLGSFDWRAYWSRQGIYFDGTLPSVLLMKKLPNRKGNPLIRETQRLRTWLLNRLDALIPPGEARAVLHAMLLGDRGALDDSLRNAFRLSGAYHVLVISSLHIGVLAFSLFWLFRAAGASDWLITLATIATLILYLLIVEDRPPTERAG